MGERIIRPRRPSPRRLGDLLLLDDRLRAAPDSPGVSEVAVTGASLDSRTVQAGDLYIARPGSHTHGIAHVDAARAAGAVAVLTDPASVDRAAGTGLPVLVADDPRAVVGRVAAWAYGEPARSLLMLGVTGTNGKTTTVWLIDAALRAAGRRTGMVGTVATTVAGERLPSVRTTPEATDLHALLAVMVERGVDAVAMEVSSHALALGRVEACGFDVVGFTNLSQDHLDFHADMNSYFAAKALLFTSQHSRRGVVTVDDDWGRRLARESDVPVSTLGERDADWLWSGESGLRLVGPSGVWDVPVSLPGRFNLANAALALVMLVEAGIDPAAAARGLSELRSVPGRMQRIDAGQPFTVLVDYAHTPDAVARLLVEARRLAGPGRVMTVLGGGGDRDAAKRPLMGRAAAAGSDRLIVTDDNPRSEDPAAIRAAILGGADGPAEVVEIGDRRAAIETALRAAAADDVVVIAGKGHETGQEIAGVVLPFDDASVATETLHLLGADTAPNRRRAPA